jgi:hypothetical protein
MHLRITGDIAAQSGLAQIIDDWSGLTRQHFVAKDYGNGLLGLVVVLMCQGQELNRKRRIRLSKKEKKLYLDVMLDLDEMRKVDQQVRKTIVAERLADDVPGGLRRYSIPDFDQVRFIEDFKSWLLEINKSVH